MTGGITGQEARPIPDADATRKLVLWPLPDQRHLYMLVAGVVLGVLLGPAVLGRFAPNQYDALFIGSGDTSAVQAARAELEKFKTDADTRQALIEEVIRQYALVADEGDSPMTGRDEQLANLTNRFADEEDALRAAVEEARLPVLVRRQEHMDKLSGMATLMLLLVVLLFAAEAILSPQRSELESGRAVLPPVLSRLVTVRYALASGWLMLMLAQPVWLRRIDPWFGLLLLTVVLVAGLAPLGRRAA